MSKNRVSIPAEQLSPKDDDVLKILFEQHFSLEFALSPASIDEVMALRYQVYCRERTFEDANCFPDGRERDAYDHRSAHALIRHRTSGECIAAVRLVLAEERDPSALFPVEAHCGEAMPQTGRTALEDTPRTRVAEISRLAVSREIRQRVGQAGQANGLHDDTGHATEIDACLMPHIVVGLFAAVVQLSAKMGITHWLAVMEPTLLRLLKRYGIYFSHVGRVVNYHGRRKPAITQARTLVDGIRAERPDVWNLMTDAGTILPARPAQPNRRPEPVATSIFDRSIPDGWFVPQPAQRRAVG